MLPLSYECLCCLISLQSYLNPAQKLPYTCKIFRFDSTFIFLNFCSNISFKSSLSSSVLRTAVIEPKHDKQLWLNQSMTNSCDWTEARQTAGIELSTTNSCDWTEAWQTAVIEPKHNKQLWLNRARQTAVIKLKHDKQLWLNRSTTNSCDWTEARQTAVIELKHNKQMWLNRERQTTVIEPSTTNSCNWTKHNQLETRRTAVNQNFSVQLSLNQK